jgi:GT2 family glycosyltransferase
MINIAILMAVHNRREVTLNGLFCLKKALSRLNNLKYKIYLTDDDSADSTGKVIKNNFPDIIIINGSGNLYWNRGMLLAWEEASKQFDYDFYILFNDDNILFEDSLLILFDTSNKINNMSIVSGAFRSQIYNKPTYGGMHRGQLLAPNGNLISFDWLNGNLVLIPKVIFNRVGMLDPWFHHGMGDLDYGLRAIKSGFKLILTPQYIGYCERHDYLKPKCYDLKYSIFSRLKFLYQPLGPNPLINSLFFFRHYTVFSGIKFIITTHLITLFPCLLGIKNKIKNFLSQIKMKI